ncbi:putative telomeric repeat binding factor 1 [Plasmodium gaboni]|uniref:Putative telomeric repeat binding factor 1 n=1 Tax=Plasmodium gaboni TaxID=647221 RepID=A0A151LMA4_9APIC|nr:putative telomeric repeat binding factor 1 [Plasmodium gaboni]KYO00229.1 putative telomeric repeat binding factor 1 [Plasmodium gaboni]
MDLQLLKIKRSILLDEGISPVLIDTKDIEGKAKINKKKIKYKTPVKWEKEETKFLIEGINTYGLSKWSQILQSYNFPQYRFFIYKEKKKKKKQKIKF